VESPTAPETGIARRDDAQAQDAMKRAIQIDALSDAELAQADAMGKQIAAAAARKRANSRGRGGCLGTYYGWLPRSQSSPLSQRGFAAVPSTSR